MVRYEQFKDRAYRPSGEQPKALETIIIGGPTIGKTAMLRKIAEAALDRGENVVIISKMGNVTRGPDFAKDITPPKQEQKKITDGRT